MALVHHLLRLGPLDNDTYLLVCEATREAALVDVGFEPEVRFPAAVAETWEWFQAERVAERQGFDFSYEDELLRLVKERAG